MAPVKVNKSALQRLAEENDRQAKDFDPEDLQHERDSDSDDDASDLSEGDATAHYEAVGDSKLRKPAKQELGPQYAGSKISRNDLDQSDDDMDSDGDKDDELSDAMDEDALDGDMGSASSGISGFDEDELSDEEEEDDSMGDGAFDSDESGDDDEDDTGPSKQERDLASVLRQNEEKAAVSNAQIAQSDIEKGQAVKKQRATFNTLLNARMKLQKGLVAANTLPTVQAEEVLSPSDKKVIEAAESAALSLFNKISELRLQWVAENQSEPRGTKRQFSATQDTPTSELRDHLQALEKGSAPTRKATLTRWAQKTQSGTIAARTSKLRDAPAQQPFVNMLDSQLTTSNAARLVSRSRIPRSCAPVQAEKSKDEDPAVYDDADWYALLLRDMVESKLGETNGDAADRTSNGPTLTAASVDALRRQAKTHRANVDVKASKGRKLRYTVQEKLQNFMAPDDRTTWSERQITELFGSLLGKRVAGGLDEDGEADEADASDAQGQPFRLFAGQ